MSDPTQTPAAPKPAAQAPATAAPAAAPAGPAPATSKAAAATTAPAAATAPKAAPAPAPAPEPIDVDAIVLSPIVDLSIARLQAARTEVAGWAHNLTRALADDVAAGRLTVAEATAVAESVTFQLVVEIEVEAPAD
jgi:hypothetical protein